MYVLNVKLIKDRHKIQRGKGNAEYQVIINSSVIMGWFIAFI